MVYDTKTLALLHAMPDSKIQLGIQTEVNRMQGEKKQNQR